MDKPILNFEIFELPFFNEGKYPQSPRSNLEILLSNKSEDISEEDIEEEEDNGGRMPWGWPRQICGEDAGWKFICRRRAGRGFAMNP